MSTTLPIHIIDAFTDTLFSGNPAAVMVLDDWLDVGLMQRIASENNLSETAFVRRRGAGRFDIRWFSPLTEVAFCGHATLASGFVLFAEQPEASELHFYAKAVGNIVVRRLGQERLGDGRLEDSLLEMAFPNRAPEALEMRQAPRALLAGLSIAPIAVLQSQQAYFAVYTASSDVLAVVPDLEQLKTLAPRDVVVTAPGDVESDFDFVSRYFWPANGGAEDPVTGSIHAGLAPYWAARLGKMTLTARQASRRGGVLHCRVADDTVYVAGQCVVFSKGFVNAASFII